jgi:hypothetical protein
MPHVTVYYKMYLPANHHRQPRNTATELILSPTSGSDVPNPGQFTPPFFSQLPYTLNGGDGMAKMLFWNVTDGTRGQVLPPFQFDQQVAANPLTITAWYWPISGPGSINGAPGIIDDAFSAALGRFIDDTFVTVTSDSALTSGANVVGYVPTNNAVTLEAKGTVVSTKEPFRQWILNDVLMPVGTEKLEVPKNTTGIAIAVYQDQDIVVVRPDDPHGYEQGPAIIIGGVKVDGGGWIIIGGKPHPIDPWGPLMERLSKSAAVAQVAGGLDRKAAIEIRKVAAKAAIKTIEEIMPELKKQAGGK